jgi:pSer/pThr/pTyr-binding forkhead associated (FHA) protein
VLRQGLLSGRLGTDTFVERVDAAYQAKTRDELEAVTGDLPRHRRVWQAIFARVATAVAPPPIPLQPPEMREGESRVLGRNPSCDYAIADATVSARHAELARTRGGWRIRDLGSRNGTRVNGWLVREQGLQTGDTIELGATVFVFRPAD